SASVGSLPPSGIDPAALRTNQLCVAGIVLELQNCAAWCQELDLVDKAAGVVVVEFDLDGRSGELGLDPIEDRPERRNRARIAGRLGTGVIVVGPGRDHEREQEGRDDETPI